MVVIVVDFGQLSKKKNCGSQMANDVIMDSDECTDQAQTKEMNLTVNLRGRRVISGKRLCSFKNV